MYRTLVPSMNLMNSTNGNAQPTSRPVNVPPQMQPGLQGSGPYPYGYQAPYAGVAALSEALERDRKRPLPATLVPATSPLAGLSANRTKKRLRRKAAEIDRKYRCTIGTCNKAYGSEGALKMHIKLKHKGTNNGSPQQPQHPAPVGTVPIVEPARSNATPYPAPVGPNFGHAPAAHPFFYSTQSPAFAVYSPAAHLEPIPHTSALASAAAAAAARDRPPTPPGAPSAMMVDSPPQKPHPMPSPDREGKQPAATDEGPLTLPPFRPAENIFPGKLKLPTLTPEQDPLTAMITSSDPRRLKEATTTPHGSAADTKKLIDTLPPLLRDALIFGEKDAAPADGAPPADDKAAAPEPPAGEDRSPKKRGIVEINVIPAPDEEAPKKRMKEDREQRQDREGEGEFSFPPSPGSSDKNPEPPKAPPNPNPAAPSPSSPLKTPAKHFLTKDGAGGSASDNDELISPPSSPKLRRGDSEKRPLSPKRRDSASDDEEANVARSSGAKKKASSSVFDASHPERSTKRPKVSLPLIPEPYHPRGSA